LSLIGATMPIFGGGTSDGLVARVVF
jgi:hypothetical protein